MFSLPRLAAHTSVVAAIFFVLAPGVSCSGPSESNDETGGAGASGDDDSTGEACDFGPDESKCEGRSDVVCSPYVASGGDPCDRDAQCNDDELCLVDDDTGRATCSRILGECSPRCGGDFNCPQGEHCHSENGTCQTKPPQGDGFGTSCDPEDSECQGPCVEFENGTSECEEHCRVGASSGCGMEKLEGSGVACAYFAYDLSALDVEQGAGDTGICAHLCDCNSDCPDDQNCLDWPMDGSAGVCTGGLESSDGITCSP